MTAFLYGSVKMIFAAKEAVEKKAIAKGREQGVEQERRRILDALERDGILNLLERHGIELPPDLDNGLNGSGSASRS